MARRKCRRLMSMPANEWMRVLKEKDTPSAAHAHTTGAIQFTIKSHRKKHHTPSHTSHCTHTHTHTHSLIRTNVYACAQSLTHNIARWPSSRISNTTQRPSPNIGPSLHRCFRPRLKHRSCASFAVAAQCGDGWMADDGCHRKPHRRWCVLCARAVWKHDGRVLLLRRFDAGVHGIVPRAELVRCHVFVRVSV